MKKISLIKLSVAGMLLILLCDASLVFAQQENKIYFGIGYNITQPIQNPFTNETGLWGGHIETEYYIDSTYSVGLNVAWNTLLKYIPTKTYDIQGQTGNLTTDMYNSVFNIPITLFGRYHFMQNGRFKPFAGIALGAQNTEFSQFYSIYQNKQTSWGFIARPEVGTLISLSKNEKAYLILNVDYSYSTNKNKDLSIKSIQGLGGSIGIQIHLDKGY